MTDNSITNNTQESPLVTSQILNTGGTKLIQEFKPLENICGFLSAFHLYADDHSRVVEAHHYCSELNEGGRSTYHSVVSANSSWMIADFAKTSDNV